MDLKEMSPEQIDVHSECGSPDLEERRWVNINTNKIGDVDGTDDIYCNHCEKIIYVDKVISMADYDDNKFDMSEENEVLEKLRDETLGDAGEKVEKMIKLERDHYQNSDVRENDVTKPYFSNQERKNLKIQQQVSGKDADNISKKTMKH